MPIYYTHRAFMEQLARQQHRTARWQRNGTSDAFTGPAAQYIKLLRLTKCTLARAIGRVRIENQHRR